MINFFIHQWIISLFAFTIKNNRNLKIYFTDIIFINSVEKFIINWCIIIENDIPIIFGVF
ncbi:hypothetical protein DMQ17_17865 [Klebsiella pneumoniae]|nr:hypothetical protein [Klebsiella pneumoniae]PLM02564.1 hypothetical protein CWN51_30575 [Klebsiella pneumoniae]PLN45128.1 hypothetical protein CWN65_28425 [Klebsiella pneumoniae]PLO23971.1 hypothetical protein CWN38_28140 [Klebsiella pneumoniae]PTN57957.1 hypothetical protein C9884_24990 [Klebsiella pneumoniae]